MCIRDRGRLLARHHVKGDNEENRRFGENELARCKTMGIEAGKVPVSYTHLDVYKRQVTICSSAWIVVVPAGMGTQGLATAAAMEIRLCP